MSIDFTPNYTQINAQQPFRFWCQKVLPLVYDDSLSYYELLNKVVEYLNVTMENMADTADNVSGLFQAYTELQGYVNNYFDNLDVQEEINNKLDAMAINGSLSQLIEPFVPDIVTNWLANNVEPVGSAVIVDSSLSVSGAAADAKITGIRTTNNFAAARSEAINNGYDMSGQFNFTGGQTVRYNTGALQTNGASWGCYSDYVDISSFEYLIVRLPKTTEDFYAGIAFYDANRTYINGYSGETDATFAGDSALYKCFVPKTAKYARTTWYRPEYESQPQYQFECYAHMVKTETESIDKVFSLEIGSVNTSGVPVDDARRVRSKDFIPVNENTVVIINSNGNTRVAFLWYDINYEYVAQDTKYYYIDLKNEKPVIWTPPIEAKYLKLVIRHNAANNNENMTPEDVVRFYNEITIEQKYYADYKLKELLKQTLNTNITSVAHRGYSEDAPENTLPAYILARKNGFTVAECDVEFTSDNVPVLLHDTTINRTARNSDGTEISNTIRISDITYAQALNYDFGIWFSPEYAGTKIPTLKEFVLLCKRIGIKPFIEIKSGGTTTENIAAMVEVVKSCGMIKNVTFISLNNTYLNTVAQLITNSNIVYVVTGVTETTIEQAEALKVNGNTPFIATRSYTEPEITLCKNANLPAFVWLVSDIQTMLALPDYVSGIISNWINAGQEYMNRIL